MQVSSLREEIDKQRSSHELLTRSTQNQIDHLKSALEERKVAFDSLSSKLSSAESELLLSRKTISEQKVVVKKLGTELQDEKEQKAMAEKQQRKK